MNVYASQTKVSTERSRLEIEKILTRYGADRFGYAWEDDQTMIQFRMRSKTIRFMLELPSRTSIEFTETSTGRARSIESANTEYNKACRQKWRALVLCIKAKLESVASGILSFDEEFLPLIVLPDGSRVKDHVLPALETTLLTGKVAGFLPEASQDGVVDGEVIEGDQ